MMLKLVYTAKEVKKDYTDRTEEQHIAETDTKDGFYRTYDKVGMLIYLFDFYISKCKPTDKQKVYLANRFQQILNK